MQAELAGSRLLELAPSGLEERAAAGGMTELAVYTDEAGADADTRRVRRRGGNGARPPGLGGALACVPSPRARRRPVDRAALGDGSAGRDLRRGRPWPRVRDGCPSHDARLHRAPLAARSLQRPRCRDRVGGDRRRCGQARLPARGRAGHRPRRGRSREPHCPSKRRDVLVGRADVLLDELPDAALVVANIELRVVEALLDRQPASLGGHLRLSRPRATAGARAGSRGPRLELDGWAADLLAFSGQRF